MRRVLMLGSSADLYGAPQVMLASARALSEDGWQVIVALPADGPQVEELTRVGAEVSVLPDFALRRRYMRASGVAPLVRHQIRLLAWAVREHRLDHFDLVYSNTQSVIVGPLAALFMRCPHLWHVHEILISPAHRARVLAWAAWVGSEVVICPSCAVARHLQSRCSRVAKKLTVLPNPVDLEILSQIHRSNRHDVIDVGVIARLHPWKGQELAIRAVASCRQNAVPARLHLFGDSVPGNESVESELHELAYELGISEHVVFHGFIDDPRSIYEALDVVLVPSTAPEPFSLVCLEAQAAGLPVIAPREGGPPELVLDGKTGLLVRPRSVEEIASAIKLLWHHPDQGRRMGEEGRRHVATHFTLSGYERGLQEIARISDERRA